MYNEEKNALTIIRSVQNQTLQDIEIVCVNDNSNDKTLEISKEQLEKCLLKKPHIIIEDRGVFDNYIWYQMMYERGEIGLETYNKKMSDVNDTLNMIDQLYFMTAEPSIIVKRDYQDQIFLEPRKKTTVEGVTMLKNGMEHLKDKIFLKLKHLLLFQMV